MKSQPVKTKAKATKPAAKAKAPAKKAPAKPVAKAKVAAKPVKAAAKPAAKAKPVSKPVAKAKAKPPVKASGKKASAAVKAKPTPKSTAGAKPVKAVKPGKPAQKAAPKAVPKSAPKAVQKPVQKPAAKPAKPVAKPVANPAPSPALPVAKAPVAVPPPVVAPAAAPVRSSKASARLAQITVPSMAQSVASTAAKSSYIQTMSSPVLIPPPATVARKDPKLANNWKTKAADQLSDAEVVAMPDAEYMNDKQLAFFRFKLSQLKQDILNNAGETTEHLREDTVIVPDPADRATIEEEHALELRTRDRERKLLKKIEQSIARIDAGDYGYCDETGEPIGVGRLLARPTATLSLEAQQRRELKQKMFGD